MVEPTNAERTDPAILAAEEKIRLQEIALDSVCHSLNEERAKIAKLTQTVISAIEGYDRQPFPGMEAGIELVKKDIIHRVKKALAKI